MVLICGLVTAGAVLQSGPGGGGRGAGEERFHCVDATATDAPQPQPQQHLPTYDWPPPPPLPPPYNVARQLDNYLHCPHDDEERKPGRTRSQSGISSSRVRQRGIPITFAGKMTAAPTHHRASDLPSERALRTNRVRRCLSFRTCAHVGSGQGEIV